MTLGAFGAPRRYVQGRGALTALTGIAAPLGRRPCIVGDPVALDLLGKRLREALGGDTNVLSFQGECTAAEIDRLAALAQSDGADLVIGVGGGKAIDTAKGVRMVLDAPLIVVPTVASNDSPTSRLIVVYSEEHELEDVRRMHENPDAVLVDTTVIAQAPERFLLAGIGDAISKKFEAEQCFTAGALNFHQGRPTHLALVIADSCYQTIRRDAESALRSRREGALGDPFERVVETVVLLSGLAFENGGLSIAHSLLRGFSAIPEMSGALHGEQVAFGLLVQLVLEGRDPGFLTDLVSFYRRIGLPSSLSQLGLDKAPITAIERIARKTCDTAPYLRNFRDTVDSATLVKALCQANAWGGE